MVRSHKVLLLYTENGGLEGKHLLCYLKKADSSYVNPPPLTPTMLIQTKIVGRQFFENEHSEPSRKTILSICWK